MDLPEPEDRLLWIVIGVPFGIFVVGSIVLLYLLPGLSNTNKALVIATGLGALGTLALALATVYNVIQTNRMLESREREREKPLVVDELSYVIQPAIEALENNLQTIQESEHEGCAFEWVYIDKPDITGRRRGPRSVRIEDSLSFARLHSRDLELYGSLRTHDNIVIQIAHEASRFHEEMKPEIKRLLEEEGISDLEQSLKVVTSAILKELEHFGESHELYDFWEKHRGHLIDYAKETPEVTLEDIQAGERSYRQLLIENTLSKLKKRKAILKRDYRISEDEIIPIEYDEWEDW